ncbi:MAG: O-antigen ligase family protein [Planctomycetes bacterium]|nr:O-antigen ligase family protein [Planctomycetota bacterium]
MASAIEKSSLFLLLVVVALRPIVAETYDSGGAEMRFTGISDLPPLVTLGIDAVILLAACGWLLARAIGPAPAYRRCGIEGGAVLVAVAGVVSCMAAGNKRVAINATIDWLMLPVVAIVLANLLRRRWHIRLALCVILSIAAVQAVQCFDQVLVTNKETQRRFMQDRERFWAERGVPLDSPTVTLFEQRLRAGEATGYLAHSNVTGGYLILCGLATVAFGVARWRGSAQPFRKGFAVLTLLIGGGLLAAAVTTQSKGALAAAGIGGLCWLVAYRLRGMIDQHRRRLWIGGWCAVGVIALGVVGYGSASGGLPHPSLNFRWGYWTASARMIGDHPWTGVGRENFGQHYLAYKSIEHPEEVSNPHNFLVQAGTDWGGVGLIGMVWMMIGASRVVTRQLPKQAPVGTNADPPGRPMLWAVALMGVVFLIRIPMLGSDNSAYVLISTLIPFVVMATAFAILAMETNVAHQFMDDALPGLTLGINCALLAFLVQDTINFALIVPGAATTFFALFGVAVALRAPESEPTHPPRGGRWIILAVGVVLLLIHAGKFVWPVVDSQAWRIVATHQKHPWPDEPPNRQHIYGCLAKASERDPFDPTPAVELAGWLQSAAHLLPDETAALAEAVEWMHEATRRNPRSTTLHRQLSALHQRLAERSDQAVHLRAAAEAERRVVELYPESPDAHINLGDRLAALAAVVGDVAAFDEGADHYQTALDLDAARPAWETIRRFSSAKRAEIETRRDGIMEAGNALRTPGHAARNPSRPGAGG